MFDKLQNLNVEHCSETELKAWVRQAIPVVTSFLKAGVRLTQFEEKQPELCPCNNCDKAKTCKKPCNLLESMLPGVQSGSSILSRTVGDTTNFLVKKEELKNTGRHTPSLYTMDIPAPDAMFYIYSRCQEVFSKAQWEVVYLKFKNGLQNKDVAKQLNIAPSSVCDRLRRAKTSMQKYYGKQKIEGRRTNKHE